MSRKMRGQAMTEYVIIIAAVGIATIPIMTKFGQALSEKTQEAASVIAGSTDLNSALNAGVSSPSGEGNTDESSSRNQEPTSDTKTSNDPPKPTQAATEQPKPEPPQPVQPEPEQPPSNVLAETLAVLTDPKSVLEAYQRNYGKLAFDVFEGAALGKAMDIWRDNGMNEQDIKRIYDIVKGYNAAKNIPAETFKALATGDLWGIPKAWYDVIKPVGTLAVDGINQAILAVEEVSTGLTKVSYEFHAIGIFEDLGSGKETARVEQLEPAQREQFQNILNQVNNGQLSTYDASNQGAQILRNQ